MFEDICKIYKNYEREIKFRGKDIETGEWIEGDLVQRMGYMPSIIFPYESNGKVRYGECAVKRDTVGQFTGLIDKNGKEIYEGDIVKTKHFGKDLKSGNHFVNVSAEDVFEIKYINAQFVFNNEARWFYLHRNTPCEIIGNIHDNPELLKGE